MNAPLEYLSGEEILKGDRVLFHGNPAEIELVAVDPNDPEHVWHVREFGGRVLVIDPHVSGRTFIPRDQLAEYEDLEFVARAREGFCVISGFVNHPDSAFIGYSSRSATIGSMPPARRAGSQQAIAVTRKNKALITAYVVGSVG